MENASKALIMAGTILIALMIIALGVQLIHTYANFTAQNEQDIANQQKIQYNVKFEKFKDKELSFQDVITITNLAREYNEKYDIKDIKNDGITVIFGVSDYSKSEINISEQLTKHNPEKEYKIQKIEYNDNGIVKSVAIK